LYSFLYGDYIIHIQVFCFLLLSCPAYIWPPLSVTSVSHRCICVRSIFHIWLLAFWTWPFVLTICWQFKFHSGLFSPVWELRFISVRVQAVNVKVLSFHPVALTLAVHTPNILIQFLSNKGGLQTHVRTG
jgi:hypothetical protein